MDGQIEVVNRKFILNFFVANMRLHGIGEIALTVTGMPWACTVVILFSSKK